MRALALMLIIVAAMGGNVGAQLPAQKSTKGKGDRPTTAPRGISIAPESKQVPVTSLASRNGGAPRVAAAMSRLDYAIGIRGYAAEDGVVVLATSNRRDLDRGGRNRCPAAEIEVDFRGNGRMTRVRLEPGDKITAVDGFEVNSLDELAVAVNSASDPHSIEIVFIDWRTGNEYMGWIDAMRVN